MRGSITSSLTMAYALCGIGALTSHAGVSVYKEFPERGLHRVDEFFGVNDSLGVMADSMIMGFLGGLHSGLPMIIEYQSALGMSFKQPAGQARIPSQSFASSLLDGSEDTRETCPRLFFSCTALPEHSGLSR